METSNVADNYWHGHSGPFLITQLTKSDISPMQLAFINATVGNGFKEVKDFNAGQHGVGPYPMNIVDGHRMNTGMTYLNDNVRNRKNLTIIGNAIGDNAVSAAPNPTVIMAAEKIADQIKKTL